MILRWLEAIIWWVSYLVFPVLLYLIVQIWQEPAVWYWPVAFLLGALFVYSRFVEPWKLLVVKENFDLGRGEKVEVFTDDKNVAKVVILADIHLGIFKGTAWLEVIVQQVLEIKPDLVLIPGDLINNPKRVELGNLFTRLKDLPCPVYAVTGNHDARKPGYIATEEVREAIRRFGVKVIDNAMEQCLLPNGKILNIYGLSDLMEGQMDVGILKGMDAKKNNLIMAHNPDAAYLLPIGCPAKLMISGHTHGGQIRIPVVYKWLIPCKHPFDRGWYEVEDLKVLVSSGLGEVILPMRLGVPPEIVILKLKLQ